VEDDGLSLLPISIGPEFEVTPVATHLSYKPDEPFTRLLEQQDPTPIRFVVTKRSGGSNKIHVTYLTLAGVQNIPSGWNRSS
jgi:hypothetical protein